MNTVTIPQREYQSLVDTKLRFEYVRRVLDEQFFALPPIKSRGKIIAALRSTKLYNKKLMNVQTISINCSTVVTIRCVY